MAVREIIQLGNSLLWEKARIIDDPTSSESVTVVTDLSDTLSAFRRDHGFGRAIAAPQIGALKQAIYVSMQDGGFRGALINPRIVWTSPERMELWDDCFSFPQLLVRVSRSASVRVEYIDEKGDEQSIEVDGDLSELLQHEIDHLHGILAAQRALSPQSLMTRSEWERIGRPR